jgi:hypothetical protein
MKYESTKIVKMLKDIMEFVIEKPSKDSLERNQGINELSISVAHALTNEECEHFMDNYDVFTTGRYVRYFKFTEKYFLKNHPKLRKAFPTDVSLYATLDQNPHLKWWRKKSKKLRDYLEL